MIGATLLGVVAQRLVRRLCPHCKEPGQVPKEAWDMLVSPHRVKYPTETMVAKGCDECRHTGFHGREGIYEILRVDDSLNEMITPTVNTSDLRRSALEHGMRPLRISGAHKIAAGKTTIEGVISVVQAG